MTKLCKYSVLALSVLLAGLLGSGVAYAVECSGPYAQKVLADVTVVDAGDYSGASVSLTLGFTTAPVSYRMNFRHRVVGFGTLFLTNGPWESAYMTTGMKVQNSAAAIIPEGVTFFENLVESCSYYGVSDPCYAQAGNSQDGANVVGLRKINYELPPIGG